MSLNQTEQVATETPKKGKDKGLLFLALAITAIVTVTAISLLIIGNLNPAKERAIITPVEQGNGVQTPKEEVPASEETGPSVVVVDTQTSKLSQQNTSSDLTSIEKDLSDTNFLDLDDGSSNLDLSIY